MHLLFRTTLMAALFSAPLATLSAQAMDPSGHWEGSLEAPGMEVKIEIDLATNGQGELTGTFSKPAEKLKGLPLSDIAIEHQSVRFQIKGAPRERVFEGDLSADGKSISGIYSQSGYTIPFSLTLMGEARIEAPAKNAAIGKEFEGVWNGTLEADGKQLHAILTLSNQADGTSIASLVSVDEGLDIPITTITQRASSLTLDLKAVGGFYSASLNPAGTELTGTYTQGSLALPLTFSRSTAPGTKR